MIKLITLALSLCLSLMLAGCASQYTFNSNLDAKAINEYFKPSEVRVYQDNNQPIGTYNTLGLVEGESCQQKEGDIPANFTDARTQARKKAADLNANGIIIKTCTLLSQEALGSSSSQRCVTKAICIAQAIKTSTNKAN